MPHVRKRQFTTTHGKEQRLLRVIGYGLLLGEMFLPEPLHCLFPVTI